MMRGVVTRRGVVVMRGVATRNGVSLRCVLQVCPSVMVILIEAH